MLSAFPGQEHSTLVWALTLLRPSLSTMGSNYTLLSFSPFQVSLTLRRDERDRDARVQGNGDTHLETVAMVTGPPTTCEVHDWLEWQGLKLKPIKGDL